MEEGMAEVAMVEDGVAHREEDMVDMGALEEDDEGAVNEGKTESYQKE